MSSAMLSTGGSTRSARPRPSNGRRGGLGLACSAAGLAGRLTAEYGGQSVALPTIAAFATSPIYLNPFAGDGFIAFSDPVAGAGSNGWLIISGD
jgi:hypothetical protein